MSKKPRKKETTENQDINLEKYIKALKLEDIGSWTKESQEAYVRARLKARRKQTKEERAQQKKDDHWDLF
ncbi:MAG: hypothetical protein GY943_21260 [Chloroflexi bacterium]|nr:hypothetical protein [Chloroflexota bacterium]